ncbi:hypothetical protein R5R35_007248 [Gryllus longicercus]|uniref:Major facilitator superfamily (MFS) profile domain-containing protein n=1 Tax=Gryllus longicercus TaxID=2509291 RepID=A0AAN9VTC6_9ORTH
MAGMSEKKTDEDFCSEPILTAPNEAEWIRSAQPGLDPRPATSHDGSVIYIWRQHLAAFLANIPSLVTGITIGWTAPAVPILLGQVEDAQPLRLSLEQASWVGGLMPLASLGGALVAGPLAERVGRKGALLLGALPTLVGWLLMAFAGPSVWLLMVGRALTGLALGAVSGPVSLYCEEVADIRVRGALGSLHFAMQCVGLLVVYTLGASLPYFWFTVSAAILPVVFVFSFCWMPESPAYLAACGRVSDAQHALRWLRGPDVDFKAEVENMLASRSQATTHQEISLCSLCSNRPWQSNALRSLALVIALMFFQQMSGICMFTFYLVQLFQQAGGNISSSLSSIIAATAFVISTIAATATVDRIGRRFLLLVSAILMGFCLFTLALYAQLNSDNWDTAGWRWVPLVSVVTYTVAFTTGFGPVPWFLMAELLPMYSKGWASALGVCTNRIIMFIVVKESPLLLEHAGPVATYIIFGVICVISAFFIFFCVPETKGKNKADILKEIGGENA